MKNRRGFLTALTAMSGAATGLAVTAVAQAQGPADPAPSAPPAPPMSRKLPSPSALAFAATMRAFDPALSDAELHTIAREIDDARGAGAELNPPAKPLRNSDEMVARFAADEKA